MVPWLALALAVSSLHAAPSKARACVTRDASGAYHEPATFEALKDCQERRRRGYIDRAFARGREPEAAKLDAFDERQRAQARDYLSRHTVGRNEPEPASPRAPEEAASEDAPAKEPDVEPADLARLQISLDQQSDGGRHGVTPEMAADVRKFLKDRQGGVSSDMQELLDATAKDGPNLTTPTMRKIQNAARQAKAEGLDLGIDPKTEDAILNDPLEDSSAGPGVN